MPQGDSDSISPFVLKNRRSVTCPSIMSSSSSHDNTSAQSPTAITSRSSDSCPTTPISSTSPSTSNASRRLISALTNAFHSPSIKSAVTAESAGTTGGDSKRSLLKLKELSLRDENGVPFFRLKKPANPMEEGKPVGLRGVASPLDPEGLAHLLRECEGQDVDEDEAEGDVVEESEFNQTNNQAGKGRCSQGEDSEMKLPNRKRKRRKLGPLLIDMRDLSFYQQLHIRTSFNINLPSLLIKRYKRGSVSHLSLENFITYPAERVAYRQRHKSADSGSGAGNEGLVRDVGLLEEENIVVYDDLMEPGEDTAGWTLLAVLEKIVSEACGKGPRLYWLVGGFEAFRAWDGAREFVESRYGGHSPGQAGGGGGGRKFTSPTSVSSSDSNGFRRWFPRRMSVSSGPLGGGGRDSRQNLFTLDTHRRKGGGRHASKASALFPPPTASHPSIPTEPWSPHTSASPPLSTSRWGNDGPPPTTFEVSEILAGFLYLGSELTRPSQLDELASRGIKRILNMAEECPDDVAGLRDRFIYKKVNASDNVEMKDVDACITEAIQFIDDARNANEPIFVHCKAGRSRSVTVVLAYLIRHYRWPLKAAYRHVFRVRPGICPNLGFVAELLRIEEGELGVVSSLGSPLTPIKDSKMICR
ncbi:uncharacterized protein VTP21DRAFT_8810 [Calcarisporiella thermophila]|uniref:uncharacterized protein n=1 Tax=Calcarisporiella thermophila TaxID=911321 RepID=UPI003742941D